MDRRTKLQSLDCKAVVVESKHNQLRHASDAESSLCRNRKCVPDFERSGESTDGVNVDGRDPCLRGE